tara:strand:+ start:185 stop:409 length:225 start_codon:yes stop_codon:yes gene_type:complete
VRIESALLPKSKLKSNINALKIKEKIVTIMAVLKDLLFIDIEDKILLLEKIWLKVKMTNSTIIKLVRVFRFMSL